MDPDTLTTFDGFAAAGTIALVAAAVSAWRERRHRQRADLDQVSLVPWNLLSAVFSMLAIILLATAAKLQFTQFR
jgi:ABC-type xylose transport system permease subunit